MSKDLREHVKAIEKAVQRLSVSKTDLTKKNARAALWKAMARLKLAVQKHYAIRYQQPLVCVFCKVPMKNWSSYAKHLHMMHRCTERSFFECWCGKRWTKMNEQSPDPKSYIFHRFRRSTTGAFRHDWMYASMGRHLSKVDLKQHILLGMLKDE